MRCAVCDWPGEVQVWVRRASGGRREILLVCDDACKGEGLALLAPCGITETKEVLGFDVFIPIWEKPRFSYINIRKELGHGEICETSD